MILLFSPIWRSPRHCFENTTTKTMQFHMCPLMTSIAVARSLLAQQTLCHATNPLYPTILTNWRNISRSSARISGNVIRFGGGGANGRIGLISTVLLVMCFVFQVCGVPLHYCLSIYGAFRVCCRSRTSFFKRQGHHLTSPCQPSARHYSSPYGPQAPPSSHAPA